MLRFSTVAYNPNVSAQTHSNPHFHEMDKDAALVTTAAPEDMENPHEKPDKLEQNIGRSSFSERGVFEVGLGVVTFEFGSLISTSAIHQPTRDQQLWFHPASCLGGRWSLLFACMAERWPRRPRVRVYARWYWLHPHRYGSGRDGVYVNRTSTNSPVDIALKILQGSYCGCTIQVVGAFRSVRS
jgi:hypothetical protein